MHCSTLVHYANQFLKLVNLFSDNSSKNTKRPTEKAHVSKLSASLLSKLNIHCIMFKLNSMSKYAILFLSDKTWGVAAMQLTSKTWSRPGVKITFCERQTNVSSAEWTKDPLLWKQTGKE